MSAHRGTVIAIAGSYGKTTTRNILSTVLAGKLQVATPIKNHNTPLAIAKFIMSLTGKEEVVVIECGEYYPGEVTEIASMVQPDLGIITGVNEAHLSRFGTLEKTTGTVFELADYLKGKPVYVNLDDVRVASFASPEHIGYSNKGVAGVACKVTQSTLTGLQFSLSKESRSSDFSTPCIGEHLVGTIALAVQLARGLGLSDEAIDGQLKILKNAPHRFELHPLANGTMILDDSYNGNPDGVRAMLKFLATITDRRIIYITPGLVELGEANLLLHQQIGDDLAKSNIAHIVLIDTTATAIIRDRLIEQSYRGLVTVSPSMPVTLDKLDTLTLPGDLVVIQNDWGDQYN
jgi:UDP-N-acetylmuramoyl-tripeptide--D-alanyl-D-alanine ligase